MYYLNNSSFRPTNAFIVTWDTIAPFSPSITGYVSFQIIILTDGSSSFLIMNYGSLGFTVLNGYYFQYGSFTSGNYTAVNSTDPTTSSNVGVNGKWIYRLGIFFLF